MLTALIRALRPSQWAKNLFVLAPLVFSQRLLVREDVLRSLVAFAAFCLASSAVYLVNDLRDREEDRNHPLKRHRPIASGALPVWMATGAAVVAILGASAFALTLSPDLAAILTIYLGLNFLYSLGFKRVVILDVMIVSLGFVLRVLVGGVAIRVEISHWLLMCTIFLALFLVFSKRRHELILLADDAAGQRSVLNNYSPVFLDQMINVVTASAVVSYSLYAVAPETVENFGTHHLIYTLPFVLFGVFRYLFLIYQRPERRNPTEALLSDWPFLVNLALWGLAVIVIIYGFGGLMGPA